MSKAVIFGAGNIGRSFIGNILSGNGMNIVFVDANPVLVKELNIRGEYKILIKRNEKNDEEILVKGISAVHSSKTEDILEHLNQSTLCVTSVGQVALPKVVPVIAEAVKMRLEAGKEPLDIIIAENIRNGAGYFRELFKKEGLSGDEPGLIETSIGKMVPIMTEEDLKNDNLVLNAEEYNNLILDKRGFKNSVPSFPEIKAVDNIAAWVDRKLFIHNLGHSASAYLGFLNYPDRKLIAEVLEDGKLKSMVREAVKEAAGALLLEYPSDFTKETLTEHIDDLLFRFENRALGDTVFRVGRDLSRKLGRNDRILGAAGLCIKHGLSFLNIYRVFMAALKFSAGDENGIVYEGDKEFAVNSVGMNTKEILLNLCGLHKYNDRELIEGIVSLKGEF